MNSTTMGRGHAFLAFLAYLAFVVYGSLVPFEYRDHTLRALPFSQRLDHFGE